MWGFITMVRAPSCWISCSFAFRRGFGWCETSLGGHRGKRINRHWKERLWGPLVRCLWHGFDGCRSEERQPKKRNDTLSPEVIGRLETARSLVPELISACASWNGCVLQFPPGLQSDVAGQVQASAWRKQLHRVPRCHGAGLHYQTLRR